ncbi:MAG: hypothetical protein Q8Q00_00335 [Dehalococcoidia bacterium]|nr:hypothetical protein [Dehalococcoidia bacterium]
MKPYVAILVALAVGSVMLGACGGSGGKRTPAPAASPTASPYAPTIDPARFSDQVTNRYFPLAPGTTYVYEGTKEGAAQRNEVTVTRDTRTILGVRCVVVHDTVSEGGSVVEDTFDWYAQDAEGNVWYFGEDSKEYENGKVTSTKGSWEAGVDDAQPGIVMEASPRVGDSYRQEYYQGEAEDMAKVLNINESTTVSAGSYQEVVVTEDFTLLEPDVVEHKYFAPGVGFVMGSMVKGGAEQIELVKITTN